MGQAQQGPSVGPQTLPVPSLLFGAVHAPATAVPGMCHAVQCPPAQGDAPVGGCWWVLLGSII